MSPSTRPLKIALIGNPNSGKSSLFNHLTGLNQKVANFPGVTVDKRIGSFRLSESSTATILDFPGLVSLYPSSEDEKVVIDVLSNPASEDYPDKVIVIADASNLKRSLLLLSQIIDLKFPAVLALNMLDVAKRKEIKINTPELKNVLGINIVEINARTGTGIKELKEVLSKADPDTKGIPVFSAKPLAPELLISICELMPLKNEYKAFLVAQQYSFLRSVPEEKKKKIEELCKNSCADLNKMHAQEIVTRYKIIDQIISKVVTTGNGTVDKEFSHRLDNILTHKIWGYVIFLILMFIIFQILFEGAAYPMKMVEIFFSYLPGVIHDILPSGILTDLFTDGIVAGLGGVIMFLPQILLLFAFIAILEETGYMARVSFIMDKLMRSFGLNGRSVVPLLSGVACAVPSIMATRIISNWKERLITIFIIPLMSCSARLPVYTILIALTIPDKKMFGWINLQGLTLMGLYLFGFIAALLTAIVLKIFIKTKEKGFFMMELPVYRTPRWKNVFVEMMEKARVFIFDAGKVIVAISVVLWVLASFAPGDTFSTIEQEVKNTPQFSGMNEQDIQKLIDSRKLQESYAGIIGRSIEPIIRPLGFDWKIGIALITSFAAREVFVGTMSTIYSVSGSSNETKTLQEKMRAERNEKTGLPVFTPATAFSLMIFYAIAMQCMSTLAVVFRETKGWKWPLIQLFYLSALAYIASYCVYRILI
ncbi:MAG: ferrous iron transport protein B [Bacteroidetes bacterium RIFCSPLOWO2_02_FULL_36_8]|nr:MAG: ferrous iron transport protein B [Bacteroidetes bacterium RIFCSPLOWO2_02_FULL_36_8]OFY71323.1 MAG: ferrous iron transport protein B [Bacteroidetes bacterium RIFCSPLOWO2_12_FULL_37_12]